MTNLPLQTEDMSHLAAGFGYQEQGPHVSQAALRPTKTILLFFVANTGHEASSPYSLVHIKIPRNLPVYRVRNFISYCEKSLKNIYGDAKRANLILTQVEGEDWQLEWQLPAHQIAYA